MRAAAPHLVAVIAVLWSGAALLWPAGFFIIDELIYAAATHAMATRGSLTIENGYERFASPDLTLWLLVPGPNGLAAQYPSGHAILAAPLHALLGLRGMILLNTASAVGMLVLTWRLARRITGDPGLAALAAGLLGLASFLPDYALGIWPHALSGLIVLGAVCLAIAAVEGEGRPAARSALLAGLVLGMGVTVRVDVVLAVPALALWVLLVARHPLRLGGIAALGMVPGLALASWLNAAKFGVFFPVSYGRTGGGGTDPAAYLAVAGAMAAAGALCVLLRRARVRHLLGRPPALMAGGTALVLTLVLIEPLRMAASAYLIGAYTILADLRWVEDARSGVMHHPDGTVSFWGLWKKALGQSLPWAGILGCLALVFRHPAGPGRAHVLLFVLLTIVWILPFSRSAWHGGLGSNMRYLLPVLPFLAILAASCRHALGQQAAISRDAGFRLGAAGLLLGLALALAGLWLWPGVPVAFLQQVAPQYLLLGLAAAALAATATGAVGRSGARAGVALFAPAVALGVLSGSVIDPLVNLIRRDSLRSAPTGIETVPGPSLIYAEVAEGFFSQMTAGDGLLANAGRIDGSVDPALAAAALKQGYTVLAQGESLTRRLLLANPGLVAARLPQSRGDGLFQILLKDVQRPAP